MQPCACPLFASHVLVFLSHFVSRDHFKSEVSCAVRWRPRRGRCCLAASFVPFSYMTSVSVATAPFRVKPKWKIHAHASSCLFRLCFCSVITQISTISVVRCTSSSFGFPCQLCFSPFWWFRAEERHLSVTSRDRRRKRHPRHHQVAERRGCAGTGPLQRSVIHDIIKLLNGDAGLWVGVVTGTRKTHIITFLWTCFDVLSQPRGYYDAFATAGQAALRGESGCSLPGRHCRGRVLLRIPFHR